MDIYKRLRLTNDYGPLNHLNKKNLGLLNTDRGYFRKYG